MGLCVSSTKYWSLLPGSRGPSSPTQNVAEVTPEASAQASWNILEALNTLTMEETQVPCSHVLERLRAAESSLPAVPELAPDT